MMEKKMARVLVNERALMPSTCRRQVEEIEILLEMERFNAWRFKP
jgi:hypothetical protein